MLWLLEIKNRSKKKRNKIRKRGREWSGEDRKYFVPRPSLPKDYIFIELTHTAQRLERMKIFGELCVSNENIIQP